VTRPGTARQGRARAGRSDPQTLIHRSKVPNPRQDSLSGELPPAPGVVRYSLEWGVSPAVVEAAFAIAVKLARGGYAKSTP
jgi:hypothetical protein